MRSFILDIVEIVITWTYLCLPNLYHISDSATPAERSRDKAKTHYASLSAERKMSKIAQVLNARILRKESAQGRFYLYISTVSLYLSIPIF